VLVPASERHARGHPWAIVGLWAWQAGLGLLVALPAASLARTAYGNDPRGEAPLWAEGGRALLDFAWHEKHAITVLGGVGQAVLLLALVAGLVPTAGALVAIAHRREDGRRVGLSASLAAGLKAFPAMLALLVVAGIVLALLAVAGMAVADVVKAWCSPSLGEARADAVAAVAVVPLLLAASVASVAQDLSRAAVVRFGVGAGRGLAYGVAVLRSAPLALWWSWAWRALASLAPVGAVGLVVTLGTWWPAWLLAALHQLVVFARVAIHASWWSRTLRAVELHPAALPAGVGHGGITPE
jgi:hypothetical protein